MPINERSAYWDNIKGMLIALVVLGQCLYAFQDEKLIKYIVISIYYFHMPAFVFVSGFFSKSQNSRSGRSLVRLFAAFLLLTAVHLCIALVTSGYLQIVKPYYSAWYLLALIIWRLITPYFSKIKGIIPLALVVSLLAGFWGDIDNSFAFARIISFYPFFLAGYFLSKEKAQSIINRSIKWKIPIGMALLIAGGSLAAIATIGLHPLNGDFLFHHYKEGAYLLHVLVRVSIFSVAFCVIGGMLLLSPTRTLPVLTKAGKNSLTIYLIHRPITLALNHYFSHFSTSELIIASIAFTVVVLLLLGSNSVTKVLNSLLNIVVDGFIIGEKDNDVALWKRVLVLVLILCMLSAPIIRISKNQISESHKQMNQSYSDALEK